MSALRHSLVSLSIRLRWELLALGLLVLAACAAPFIGLGPQVMIALAGLETLLLFWITLRILLAEDGFKTSGGWRCRPVPPASLLGSQIALLALVVLPPLILHALVIHRLFQPSPEQWHAFLRGSLFKTLLGWLVFVAALKLFSLLILRPLEGVARKAAWSVLVIVLIPVLLTALPERLYNNPRGSGGSGEAPEQLAQSIQQLLPDTTEFIGEWNDSGPEEVPQARLLARFPLPAKSTATGPGMMLESSSARLEGKRFSVQLFLQALDLSIIGRISNDPVAVVRYSNGMVGTCLRHRVSQTASAAPFLPTHAYRFEGSFISPFCLPEHRTVASDDFRPVEILFFGIDESLPLLRSSLDRLAGDPSAPAPPLVIPPPSRRAEFEIAVRELIDSVSNRDGHPLAALELAKQLPAEAIDPILAYGPWPENAWRIVIHPFLVRHASEAHKPVLLERLALDPQITPLIIEKGWRRDAVAVLRQRAKERLPLDITSLKLLAAQNDPEMAPDIAALARRLDRGIWDLAPALRGSAGFDWPEFVGEGWKQRKYDRSGYDREGWAYAVWAAELGDPSALRRLAVEAAAGKKWERERLARLIPAAPADPIPYLRRNLAQLAHDPATGTWR
jgi:hypothetical protein